MSSNSQVRPQFQVKITLLGKSHYLNFDNRFEFSNPKTPLTAIRWKIENIRNFAANSLRITSTASKNLVTSILDNKFEFRELKNSLRRHLAGKNRKCMKISTKRNQRLFLHFQRFQNFAKSSVLVSEI